MPRKVNDLAENLAMAIAGGESVAAFAEANRIGVRAAYRLAAKPGVRGRVAEIRARAIERGIGLLARTTASAAATIYTIMADEGQSASVRLAAAKAHIAALIDLKAAGELDARIAALEERLAEGGAGPGPKIGRKP